MNRDLLDELLRKARQALPPTSGDPPAAAPAGVARAVVNRWRSASGDELSGSWLIISRRGLAVALSLMVASLLWHARELRAPVLMESTASETVVLSLVPQ